MKRFEYGQSLRNNEFSHYIKKKVRRKKLLVNEKEEVYAISMVIKKILILRGISLKDLNSRRQRTPSDV